MVKLSQYLVLKYLELEETIKYWLQSDADFKPASDLHLNLLLTFSHNLRFALQQNGVLGIGF